MKIVVGCNISSQISFHDYTHSSYCISYLFLTIVSPFVPDHSVAFPMMEEVPGHEADPKQPLINKDGFVWPGDEGVKRKAVSGVFVLDKYLTPTTIGNSIAEPDCVDAFW